jgi:hypothetical protein
MSRELDALVAEKVMGWARDSRLTFGDDLGIKDCYYLWPEQAVYRHKSEHDAYWERWSPNGAEVIINEFVPAYSTDIAAAWQVVEKLTRPLANIRDGEWCLDRLGYRCCEHDEDGVHGEWRCSFRADKGEDAEWVHVTASTAPLAICLAALKACGVEPPREET